MVRFDPTESPIHIPGTSCEETWIDVEPGVELRLWRWAPDAEPEHPPVLFVAGWVSVIEGWAPVLRVMARRQSVLYLETREKRSARIAPRMMQPEFFGISRLAEDLRVVVRTLKLDSSETVLFGSSMGANAILEALKRDDFSCRAAFLICPNAEFLFPWWGKALTYMPSGIYHLVRPLIELYLEHRRVNSKDDPKQMERYRRTLRAADARRLKLSARAVLGYTIWDGLEKIGDPVGLAFAPSDSLHGGAEIARIVEALPRGRAIPCASNTAMHEAEVLGKLDEFLDHAAAT